MEGKYTVIEYNGVVASCKDKNDDKIYFFDEDLPRGTKVGDCIYLDRSGIVRKDMFNTWIKAKENL